MIIRSKKDERHEVTVTAETGWVRMPAWGRLGDEGRGPRGGAVTKAAVSGLPGQGGAQGEPRRRRSTNEGHGTQRGTGVLGTQW